VVHVLFKLFVFIYLYCCPARFPYQMMFVLFNCKTMGVTSATGTANPSAEPTFTLIFCEVRVSQSLVFCVLFCRSLFVPLYFLLWPLCCLSFCDYHWNSYTPYAWEKRMLLFLYFTEIQLLRTLTGTECTDW